MKIELTPKLRVAYPESMFGFLIVRGLPNRKMHEMLEERKRELERSIEKTETDMREDGVIRSYDAYFRTWGKTYPIEFQLRTIKRGGRLPNVSVLVDAMFLAELKNRLLTSGHELDAIKGDLLFDASDEGERYVKLNGEEQGLRSNDVILRDAEGILASVLYGPARRTSITSQSRNALYLAWCPYGMGEDAISGHLEDILSSLIIIDESVSSEKGILR